MPAGNSTGRIILTNADSQITPGSTSFNITNNANSQYNLSISNAGLVTLPQSAASTPLRFGADVELYRVSANALALATGDSFALVNGNIDINVGTMMVPAGSAGTPSFTLRTATNTGMFFASSQPAFAVAGAKVAEFRASGLFIGAGTGAFVTPGTNTIVLQEGSVPSGGSTDLGVIYVVDVAGSTELRYQDSSSNVSNVT